MPLARAAYHAGAAREQSVGRTLDAEPTSVQNVRVDHRRLHIATTHQRLNRADVVAGLKEMSRETVAQRLRTDRLGNPDLACGIVHGALEHRFVEMKPLR